KSLSIYKKSWTSVTVTVNFWNSQLSPHVIEFLKPTRQQTRNVYERVGITAENIIIVVGYSPTECLLNLVREIHVPIRSIQGEFVRFQRSTQSGWRRRHPGLVPTIVFVICLR